MQDRGNPIHDFTTFSIPESEEYGKPGFTVANWQKLIKQTKDGNSAKILTAFQNAKDYELKYGNGPLPKNIKDLEENIAKMQYKEAEKNPKLAKVFAHYKISEDRFERAVKFFKDLPQKKEHDNIPNVVAHHGNYYAVKLPSNDPRALILGDITGCCQNFDGHSAMCVKDGMTLPDNGFYVYLKAKPGFDPKKIDWQNLEESAEIIGQSYVWRGKTGNICLDSFEAKRGKNSKDFQANAEELLSILSHELTKHDSKIDRVTIGTGGGTDFLKFNKRYSDPAESMLTGKMYGDAEKQYEIGASQKLQEARKKVEELTKQDICISSLEEFELISNHHIKGGTFPDYLKDYIKCCIVYNKELSDIDHLSPCHISRLLSTRPQGNTQKAVAENKVSFDELIKLDSKQILSIVRAVNNPFLATKVKELYKFPDDKIKALSSTSAIELYKENAGYFDTLSKFDADKIDALTSHYAQKCYKDGLTFNEFTKFDAQKIKALTKWDAMEGYENKIIQLNEIAELDTEKIKAFTRLAAQALYKDLKKHPKEFFHYSAEKFTLLTSISARYLRDQGVDFDSIAAIEDIEKLKALTSALASDAYRKGIKFEDLVSIDDADKIKPLTSNAFVQCYKEYGWTPKDFIEFDADKIEAITRIVYGGRTLPRHTKVSTLSNAYDVMQKKDFEEFVSLVQEGDKEALEKLQAYENSPKKENLSHSEKLAQRRESKQKQSKDDPSQSLS